MSAMLAPLLQGFFVDRLARQRGASPATIAAYRDTFRLLLTHLQHVTGTPPAGLRLDHLDAEAITGFLDHLQADRGNLPRTRNARLAAIRSFFRYAALREPAHADLIARVLAIPQKRQDKAQVAYLTPAQARALAGAPDTGTWEGRRDRAFLALALHTGLRISELLSLRRVDITLGAVAQVRCTGKGRKERAVPLTPATAKVMRAWLREIPARLDAAVFATRGGRPLSRDAIEHRIALHVTAAATTCPSIAGVHVTAHVLRHTCAMNLLHAGVDSAVIAMWLGHEDLRSTQAYLHADMTIKERALERARPADVRAGRYQPRDDTLLAFLEAL